MNIVEVLATGFFGVVAAGVGAFVAAQIAVKQWRTEMIGRRRAELAEEVLADFYKIRAEGMVDVALYVAPTHPMLRNPQQLMDLLQEVHAKRYRFAALFGWDAARPFKTIRQMQDELIHHLSKMSTGEPVGEVGTLDVDGVIRGGSVCLNTCRGVSKWIGRSFRPPPGLATAG